MLRLLAADLTAATALPADLRDPSGAGAPTFTEVLVSFAAVALAAALLWFWLVTLVSCLQAATMRTVPVRALGSTRVRGVVLLACGLTLAAGMVPASADTGSSVPADRERGVLAGLPLPDRAQAPESPRAPQPQGAPAAGPPPAVPASALTIASTTVTVRSGDTLWALAASGLEPSASDAAISRHWREIWAQNLASIGPDPDRIVPGTTLTVPTATTPQENR
jgi:nucleoid-associated protein YgaU